MLINQTKKKKKNCDAIGAIEVNKCHVWLIQRFETYDVEALSCACRKRARRLSVLETKINSTIGMVEFESELKPSLKNINHGPMHECNLSEVFFVPFWQ